MKKPLLEKATQDLLDLILQRRYQVGDKIPNEYELAQDLGVGRSTVREAVRCLATRNILEVRQGSGTYISAKKGVSEDPLGFTLVRDTAKLTSDLFELRELLEPRIAERVALYATEEEVLELEEIVLKIEKAVRSGDEGHLELDVAFHSMMASMSRNIALDSLLPVINQSIHLINDNYTSYQMKEDTLQAHRDILDSIQRRDPVAAHNAALYHVLTVRRTALEPQLNL